MKLHRWQQFTKKINENTDDNLSDTGRIKSGEYDTVSEYPNQFKEPNNYDNFDDDGFSSQDTSDTSPKEDDFIRPFEDEDDDSLGDYVPSATFNEPTTSSSEDDYEYLPDEDFGDDDFGPNEYQSGGDKLDELANMLGVEVNDVHLTFGEHIVTWYPETDNLHIGTKEFASAEDAADYLKGGENRAVRDTSESRSYRFRR
jgi:hypothetical protein